MGFGDFVLGSLILYLKGMRRMRFQLSGFYYKPCLRPKVWPLRRSNGIDAHAQRTAAAGRAFGTSQSTLKEPTMGFRVSYCGGPAIVNFFRDLGIHYAIILYY